MRQALYDGADCIKVIVDTGPRVLSLEEMKVIVEEAHRVGRERHRPVDGVQGGGALPEYVEIARAAAVDADPVHVEGGLGVGVH